MVIIFDGVILLAFLVCMYILASVGSIGILNFINSNMPAIILGCFVFCALCTVAVFIAQKKECKKIYWSTLFFSVPSLIQFFYFAIKGIVTISEKSELAIFFLLIGYLIWFIINGCFVVLAQFCSVVVVETLINKYEDLTSKAMVAGPPIAVTIIGAFINYLLFS